MEEKVSNFYKNHNKLFYYNIVIATDINNGFGAQGQLPWKIPNEMKHFKFIISHAPEGKKNIVVMGRKTWDSIPINHRPLSNRINVVFTQNEEFSKNNPNIENVFYVVRNFTDYESLLQKDNIMSIMNEVYNIGGRDLLISFSQEKSQICKFIFRSLIMKEYPTCDVFYPIPEKFTKVFVSDNFYDEGEKVEYNYQILCNDLLHDEIRNSLDSLLMC
jgi:dihydrofolate reductase